MADQSASHASHFIFEVRRWVRQCMYRHVSCMHMKCTKKYARTFITVLYYSYAWCKMITKCRTYLSNETHEANMLQLRHRHEMTQYRRRKKKSTRIFILVLVIATVIVYSDSFRNYRECEGCLKSSHKESINDYSQRNLQAKTNSFCCNRVVLIPYYGAGWGGCGCCVNDAFRAHHQQNSKNSVSSSLITLRNIFIPQFHQVDSNDDLAILRRTTNSCKWQLWHPRSPIFDQIRT